MKHPTCLVLALCFVLCVFNASARPLSSAPGCDDKVNVISEMQSLCGGSFRQPCSPTFGSGSCQCGGSLRNATVECKYYNSVPLNSPMTTNIGYDSHAHYIFEDWLHMAETCDQVYTSTLTAGNGVSQDLTFNAGSFNGWKATTNPNYPSPLSTYITTESTSCWFTPTLVSLKLSNPL